MPLLNFHVLDRENGAVPAHPRVFAVRQIAHADEAGADAAAHPLFQGNERGNPLPLRRLFEGAEHGQRTAGEHHIGTESGVGEIRFKGLHGVFLFAEAAVVGDGDQPLRLSQFLQAADSRFRAKAHISGNLFFLRVFADDGDHREYSHAAAHQRHFALVCPDKKAVAERHEHV